jgi:hypothetical protein
MYEPSLTMHYLPIRPNLEYKTLSKTTFRFFPVKYSAPRCGSHIFAHTHTVFAIIFCRKKDFFSLFPRSRVIYWCQGFYGGGAESASGLIIKSLIMIWYRQLKGSKTFFFYLFWNISVLGWIYTSDLTRLEHF